LDPIVNLPIGIFALAAGLLVIRSTSRRFGFEDELPAYTAASIVGAGFVGGLTLGFARLWEGGVEIVRLGNDHLSTRGLRLQWTQHPLELFLVATTVVLAWSFLSYCLWRHRHADGTRPTV
jgi:hypothetical protein